MEMKGPPSFLSMIMRRFAIKRPLMLTSESRSLKDKLLEADGSLEAHIVGGGAISQPAKKPPSFEFVIGDKGNSEAASIIYSDIDAPPSYTDVARRDASETASVGQNLSVDQNLHVVKIEEASSTLLDFEVVTNYPVLPTKDQSKMAIFKEVSKGSGDESFVIPINLKAFTLDDLKAATKNFRPNTLLGVGGLGNVFKGWIKETTLSPVRHDTRLVVAIKVLKSKSHQGHREWLTEVNYLGKLRHKNIVRLIGYCEESQNRLLVYEFMPKGCLENHLFRKGFEPVDWATRMSIAIDVAQGLSFLHNKEPGIIYRNLTATNILLDSEFTARLSHFGLARNGLAGNNTHFSTRVVGTNGYTSPEYQATGHLTRKNDVYSFGVVLLELLSGRRAIANERVRRVEETLVGWAKPFLTNKSGVFRIMDTRLGGRYSQEGAQAVADLALKCLNNDPKLRPTMAQVVDSLEQITGTPKDVPEIWL